MDNDWLTIAFTGWGTGGHVFPISALIQYGQKDSEITKKCKQVYRIGESWSMEEQEAKKLENVWFVSVRAGKIRRYRSGTLLNIRDMANIIFAFFQSVWYIRKYKIDVLFCKGGYVALPVCVAAKLLWKKILVHESDIHPGLTNRVVAKFAHTVFTGFDKTFPDSVVTGQIMSDALLEYEQSSLDISVDNDKTQVLVMWGSQWSQAIYEAVKTLLDTGQCVDMQFHIILWTQNIGMKDSFDQYDQVRCYDFLSQKDIARLYSICDISITRGGVTSLAEQQLFGIKKIIIPHPHGGGYHQMMNALWYSDQYDDIFVEQDGQIEENLAMFLERFLGHKKSWEWLDVKEIEEAKRVVWEKMVG